MAATKTPSSRRPVVLVVDDEPRLLRFFDTFLTGEGYQVFTATCGEEALALATTASPDLVLLDIVMPGMGGVATLRELRLRGVHCPVIMLTAQGTLQTARETMLLGAHDYISKPFNLKFLKSVLSGALADGTTQRCGGDGEDSSLCVR